MTQREMTRAQVLKEFFFRSGIDTTQSFLKEFQSLTPADREEMAELAAKSMGVVVKAS